MTLLKKALFAIALVCYGAVYAQQTPVTKANYELAERFSAKKLNTLVFSTQVHPQWFQNSNKFWYSFNNGDGVRYYIVDPVAGTKNELWDMADMAAQISEITRDPFDAQHLPIQGLKLVDDKYFTFNIQSTMLVPKEEKKSDKKVESKDGKDSGEAKPKKPAPMEKKKFRFKYDLATKNLTEM